MTQNVATGRKMKSQQETTSVGPIATVTAKPRTKNGGLANLWHLEDLARDGVYNVAFLAGSLARSLTCYKAIYFSHISYFYILCIFRLLGFGAIFRHSVMPPFLVIGSPTRQPYSEYLAVIILPANPERTMQNFHLRCIMCPWLCLPHLIISYNYALHLSNWRRIQ